MVEEEYVKICPKCGGLDISFDSMSMGEFAFSNGRFEEYCSNCGYGRLKYSTVFPEIPVSEVENFRKKVVENKSKK